MERLLNAEAPEFVPTFVGAFTIDDNQRKACVTGTNDGNDDMTTFPAACKTISLAKSSNTRSRSQGKRRSSNQSKRCNEKMLAKMEKQQTDGNMYSKLKCGKRHERSMAKSTIVNKNHPTVESNFGVADIVEPQNQSGGQIFSLLDFPEMCSIGCSVKRTMLEDTTSSSYLSAIKNPAETKSSQLAASNDTSNVLDVDSPVNYLESEQAEIIDLKGSHAVKSFICRKPSTKAVEAFSSRWMEVARLHHEHELTKEKECISAPLSAASPSLRHTSNIWHSILYPVVQPPDALASTPAPKAAVLGTKAECSGCDSSSHATSSSQVKHVYSLLDWWTALCRGDHALVSRILTSGPSKYLWDVRLDDTRVENILTSTTLAAGIFRHFPSIFMTEEQLSPEVARKQQKQLSVARETSVDVSLKCKAMLQGGLNSLHLCALLGHEACLEMILLHQGETINIDTKDKICKRTALHYACEAGHGGCVSLLLKSGADRESTDKLGEAAIHKGVRSGSRRVVTALCEKGSGGGSGRYSGANSVGVKINRRNKFRQTPLMLATSSGIAVALIASGADPTSVDCFGFSAAMYAAGRGQAGLLEVLISSNSFRNTGGMQRRHIMWLVR